LFVYSYLAAALASNGLAAPLVKTQFSALLYGTGFLGAAVLCTIAVTLLTGRAYCSVLCPLGTLQELVWKAGSFLRKNKEQGGLIRTGYAPPPGIRYAVPLAVGLGLVFSFSPLMTAFDPISNFGRGMGALRALVAGAPAPFGIALAIPPALILIAAFLRGRAFCDWCPVGVSLGALSSVAPFGMTISPRCISCGICEKKCPSGCLDSRRKRIDAARCVLCFSCAAACPGGSAVYGIRGAVPRVLAGKPVLAASRRVFLKGTASFLCGALYFLGPRLRGLFRLPGADGGKLPVLPPGAKNGEQYRARCIGCQACIAACPVGIVTVKASTRPVLDYTEAACQYNCVECGRVCPTGAIRRLSVEEKHRTRIALSSLLFQSCVVNTRGEACGACAEVCPTRAITMIPYPEAGIPYLTRPVFDERYCVGCGACLVACPAEPKAFTITAAAEQTNTPGIRPTEDGGEERLFQPTEDFPF
jgi:ferredoxin